MRRKPFTFDIKHPSKPKDYLKDAPCFSYLGSEEDGKHILVVTDFASYEGLDQKPKGSECIMSYTDTEVLTNVFQYAIEKGAARPSRIDVFNWHNGEIQKRNPSNAEKAPYVYYHDRLLKFIEKSKPDVVLFCGLDAYNEFAPYALKEKSQRAQYRLRMHRVFKLKVGDHTTKLIGTVDILRPAIQDHKKVKDYPNLLGFLVEGVTYAFNGKNPYTVKIENPKAVYINTIEKWRKIYKKVVRKAKILSIDTEGLGLARLVNKLYSIQFTANGKKGYFLPLEHPETPFTASEINEIKENWRDYFERGGKDGLIAEHVYHYGKHDIMQFFQQFKIRWYCHKIFDTNAGAQALDENRKLLKHCGYKKPAGPFSLKALSEYYGVTVYSEIEFDKGNRNKMDSVHLDHEFIEYGVYDVLIPFQMRKVMLQQAKDIGHDTYHTFVTEMMKETIIAIVYMEHTGTTVDKRYLFGLRAPHSEFNKKIQEIKDKFWEFKAVKRANANLLRRHNVPPGFKTPKLFSINKEESKEELFFNVLDLKPLGNTAKGGGQTNKAFQKVYENVPEVALFTELQKMSILKSTYVDGIFKKITNSVDAHDGRIRCSYDFVDIVTGRLGSRDPNLQNIPSHGPLAKIIKRIFVASLGHIMVKNDFNAHEVRSWSNMANDKQLRDAFHFGLAKRLKLRVLGIAKKEDHEAWLAMRERVGWKDIKDANKKLEIVKSINDPGIRAFAQLDFDIEVNGDIHKINSNLFFGTPVLEVTDVQRQSVKAVVFGVLYGKGAKNLAVALSSKTKTVTEEEAQELIDLLFEKFEEGGKWVNYVKKFAQKNFYYESPVGQRRHLWGYLHNKPGVHNAMTRRAVNTPVQGVSSQFGVSSVYFYQQMAWDFFVSQNKPFSHKNILNDVHDAIESESKFHTLPIHLYLMEHASTTKLHNHYNDLYNFDFGVGLELEFQLGPSLDAIKRFDWRRSQAIDQVKATIEAQKHIYLGVKQDEKAIIKALNHNWDIIERIREKEINRTLKEDKAATYMWLNKERANDLDFKWAA